MTKLAALALILATLAAFPTTADAKNRPTVDHGDGTDCFFDPDADASFDDGLIVSCCYDDGCWICEKNPGQNCTWDPKYRTIGPVRGDLSVNPGGTIKLKAKGTMLGELSRLSSVN